MDCDNRPDWAASAGLRLTQVRESVCSGMLRATNRPDTGERCDSDPGPVLFPCDVCSYRRRGRSLRARLGRRHQQRAEHNADADALRSAGRRANSRRAIRAIHARSRPGRTGEPGRQGSAVVDLAVSGQPEHRPDRLPAALPKLPPPRRRRRGTGSLRAQQPGRRPNGPADRRSPAHRRGSCHSAPARSPKSTSTRSRWSISSPSSASSRSRLRVKG